MDVSQALAGASLTKKRATPCTTTHWKTSSTTHADPWLSMGMSTVGVDELIFHATDADTTRDEHATQSNHSRGHGDRLGVRMRSSQRGHPCSGPAQNAEVGRSEPVLAHRRSTSGPLPSPQRRPLNSMDPLPTIDRVGARAPTGRRTIGSSVRGQKSNGPPQAEEKIHTYLGVNCLKIAAEEPVNV